jgi:uncharacterized protein (DUF983 family)
MTMKKFAALLSMKCPRCHEGDLFTHKNSLSLRHLHKMPDHCEACGLKFNPEPGFYTGAMYVSYGFSVALFLLSFFTLYIGLKVEGLTFLMIYSITLLLLSPFLFRYSRTVYLYLFYSYEPQAKQDYLKSLQWCNPS